MSSATALNELSKSSKAKIHVVEISSADVEGNKKAAEQVGKLTGHVDVLIANAGKFGSGWAFVFSYCD